MKVDALPSRILCQYSCSSFLAFTFEYNISSMVSCKDFKIWALVSNGSQKRCRGWTSPAITGCSLVEPYSFLWFTVKIFVFWDAILPEGVNEFLVDWSSEGCILHIQGATLVMILVLDVLVVFRLFKELKRLLVAPPVVSKSFPFIVIPWLPSDVNHCVDWRRSSKWLSSRLVPFFRRRCFCVIF